jgi:hypothetical protein
LQEYLKTINPVIAFLQGKNPTLALQICQEDFARSTICTLEELDWALEQWERRIKPNI